MEEKNEIIQSFYSLSEYLKENGKIENLRQYERDFSAFLLHARHIKTYDFIAPFCKDKKVLDIGCFIGYGEKHLALAKEVIAIDTDDNSLEFARRNNFNSNIRFLKVDARELPFSEEVFDIIVAFQLIEHIPPKEVPSFLYKVKKILKKDGLLFIATPNRKFRLRPFQPPFNLEHYQEFTAKKLFKVLKTIFQDVSVMGIRAENWIEEIEKARVRSSIFSAYIFIPVGRILHKYSLLRMKNILKKIKRLIFSRQERQWGPNQFENLLKDFSMSDFYLEKRQDLLNGSLELFAICKK